LPTGTLVFPPERKHAPIVTEIPSRHCEMCAAVFGKAECQRGQWSHLWLLSGADASGVVAFIGAAHYEGAELYAFSIIATLDSTMFDNPMVTARSAYEHILVTSHHTNGHANAPF
jgi:hypothetical protein